MKKATGTEISLVMLGGTAGVLVLELVGLAWCALAASILWGWFVIPTFGAPPLSVPAAMGLSLFIGALRPQAARDVSMSKAVLAMFLTPMIALLFGLIVRLWM